MGGVVFLLSLECLDCVHPNFRECKSSRRKLKQNIVEGQWLHNTHFRDEHKRENIFPMLMLLKD